MAPQFSFPARNPTKRDIANLHAALQRLHMPIDAEEVSNGVIGATTRAAIGNFRDGGRSTAILPQATAARINTELQHRFVVDSKTRTRNLQDLLGRLGQTIAPDELQNRRFGATTEAAVRAFQRGASITEDGRLTDGLLVSIGDASLQQRLSTKTQIGNLQKTLLRASRIAKLDPNIDAQELKGKQNGPSTTAAIKAFQTKFRLNPTGVVDSATMRMLDSVSASRPAAIRALSPVTGTQLKPLGRVLRLNMTNKHVGDLQEMLAFLGYKIDQKEFNAKTFGATTQQAVLAYQKKLNLPVTGHVQDRTLTMLNLDVKRANPQAFVQAYSYRLRGAVRNELWQGRPGTKVQIWEKPLRGAGMMLIERPTGPNGFYDIPYDPPRNPADNQVKSPFHLQVKVVDAANVVLDTKVLFNPTLIAWVNFTGGADPYRGASEFDERMRAVATVLGVVAITTVEETEAEREVTHLAINAGLTADDVMQLVLAHRASAEAGNPTLTPAVFYAYVRQNLPPALPSDLLDATQAWTLIDQLVDQAVSGVAFMDADLQQAAFDNAAASNLIPRETAAQSATIMAALANLKQTFALNKPILIGNGTFGELLGASTVPAQNRIALAEAFIEHRGLSPEFWVDVKGRASQLGGAAAIADLETTANVGHITKNHLPTLEFLKARIADPLETRVNNARDLAKLSHADWVQLIQQNGGAVPEGTDGQTPAERRDIYAASLAAQSEQLFPSTALVAEVGRSNAHQLSRVADLQQLLDDQPDLDLGATNIDKFVVDKQIQVADDVLNEARVMQRVRRIAPQATLGRALLDNQIHSAAQVVMMGKERLVQALAGSGQDQKASLTVYGVAEFQYAQALSRIADFRAEMHRDDPAAIVKHTYSQDEQAELLGAIPNLETLFGSLDFCDCDHCESVLGPAAYLADVLRFLDSHPSEQANRTVRQVLFDKRPDLGNIKLNCENTETPLPYIDLVCEVLENAIPAPGTNEDFSFQTTRPAAQLRAFPENVRKAAYDVLRVADFPMASAFDLWQEESRAFLQHLGLVRWELMELFQSLPPAGTPEPSNVSIAAEYWGISSHEAAIITTAAATQNDQDRYWGLNSARTDIPVPEILDHTRLEYGQLLELLYVGWLNDANDANKMTINRPVDSAALDKQTLTHLTFAKLDQVHRFLRLWRHTSWRMWELDLLLRSPRVGNGTIDGAALVNLKRFRELQTRLNFSVEDGLALFGSINTESRPYPAEPQRSWPSAYERLFQNTGVTNPLNPAFALPIAAGLKLSDHRPTLLAALALTEPDLALLLARIGSDDLTVANLSSLYRFATLSRLLRTRIEELLMLIDVAGIADPFATPEATWDFLRTRDRVHASGFPVRELDYVLNLRPDSPFGLRDEVITQQIEALCESLRATPPENTDGQIIAQVAGSFTLPEELMRLLLTVLNLNGTLLSHLKDPRLTARDADGSPLTPLTPANFPRVYETYRLLHKAAKVVARHHIEKPETLAWLLANHASLGVLDLNALPVTAPPGAPLFDSWVALYRALEFAKAFPEPEGATFTGVVDLAANSASPVNDVLSALAALTTWQLTDLQTLHNGLQLQHGATSSYTTVETYERHAERFRVLKRLGVDATQVLAWARRDEENNEAQFATSQAIRQAAKSKHDEVAWLAIVEPIQDELRERKRDALVRHLIEDSLRTQPLTISFNGKDFTNPQRWRDAQDLLSYFLIDVEMSSCQDTSRVKQAMSSVQMFVQRAFLNLEQPFVQVSREEMEDTASLNSWKQWKWMKSYRIWEANRKVFLYPENWIEPELRDDKSPFFLDLENELAQSDVTQEHAEDAFRHYLEKVHEVAHLEIVGVYHEVDDDNPFDNLPPNINRLHVIGRTKSEPALYYYRSFDLNYNMWTAWARIDVDIAGEHVVPVVYNRKLHLFWLTFMEKPQKVKKQPAATIATSATPKDNPEAPTLLEIKLAWTVQQEGGWTSKRQSPHKLIHPWQRPQYSYNLKPRYKSRENLLWLDVYISTSAPFNNTRFYDPYVDSLNYVTAFRYDETARPWHSSSFVFEGDVLEVKQKALSGNYRVMLGNGTLSNTPVASNSYAYVHDAFGEDGNEIKLLSGGYEVAPRLALPEGMHFRNTRLTNNTRTANPSRVNVLERGATRNLLANARAPFEVVMSAHDVQYETVASQPVIYQDAQRAFFAKTQTQTIQIAYNQTLQRLRYTFYPMYHAYTALFLRELNRSGLDGLFTRKLQLSPQTFYPGNNFSFSSYGPASGVVADVTAQSDQLDFSQEGAYSIYNWEAFFHAPLMVACRLMQNQRFEEALRWFHYIFDPTNTEALGTPQRFWVTKPFFEQNSDDYRKQRIENLLANIAADVDQIKAWKNNPFKPHLIARFRPVAYQKTVVMKYIDNLIAWGDQLFRRDTIESINEATTLYSLAYELLGRRPVEVPDVEKLDKSYNELTADGALDPLGNKNVAVLMENFADTPVRIVRSDNAAEPLPSFDVLYFSIPRNDKLMGYWDTVEDRLFKIRHCMNIQGVVRQLPLFEPPIDPALLVKAAAAGIDLDSVLTPLAPPDTQYRFRTLTAKATEFCSDVKALGDKLLSVLEKRDSEGLALLNSVNSIGMLKAVRDVRKKAIDEALDNQASLEQARALAEAKHEYYTSREFLNAWETAALSLNGVATLAETSIALGYALAGGLAVIPRFTIGGSGFGGSPLATADAADGLRFSKAAEAAVSTISAISRAAEKQGGMSTTMGSYSRRDDEWKFSGNLASIEIDQIQKQLDGAAVRVAVSERELDNHDKEIENSQSVDEYMRNKYTNQELFNWMLTQASTVYFQSYQLAFDMAKRAEAAFRFELGQTDRGFIQFGYWDSLKKGLMAGERLQNDIHRMEAAFYDQDRRVFELMKHVSLAQVDPLALLMLRETGGCNVTAPEWLFDMDYPGHYRRRIKSVSVTIPCIVGPYSGVNCTLSLTNHGMRVKEDVGGDFGDPLTAPDDRFFKSAVPIQSIATSSAQNDAGVFELNFNDERYLPFEGAGAVSAWRIDLPKENNQFDLMTIADVVLHIRYEAEAGNLALTNAARANVNAILPASGVRLFSLRDEFASEWQRFLNPAGGTDQELTLTLGSENLPFFARAKTASVSAVELFIGSGHNGNFDIELRLPNGLASTPELAAPDLNVNGVHHMVKGVIPPNTNALGAWQIKIKRDDANDFKSLQAADVSGAFLIVKFGLS